MNTLQDNRQEYRTVSRQEVWIKRVCVIILFCIGAVVLYKAHSLILSKRGFLGLTFIGMCGVVVYLSRRRHRPVALAPGQLNKPVSGPDFSASQEDQAEDVDVVDDDINDPTKHYLERDHPLWFGFVVVVIAVCVTLAIGVVLYANSSGVNIPSSLIIFLILLASGYAGAREVWKWLNWKLEIDPSQNAVSLHRHGHRLFFVPDMGTVTIPIAETAVTKNKKNFLEQYFFQGSSTVTIDNEIQGDEMFHNMRFVRDGARIKDIVVWYNNITRRQDKAEIELLRDILGAQEQNNTLLGETNGLLQQLLDRLSDGDTV